MKATHRFGLTSAQDFRCTSEQNIFVLQTKRKTKFVEGFHVEPPLN